MTPAETLTAAADRVRDLAADADKAPWIDYRDGWCILSQPDGDDRATWRTVCSEGFTRENGRWIVALSPATSGPLESILRAAAHDVTVSGMVLNAMQFKAALEDRFGPALDLAKAILGFREENNDGE